jgi:hypothetical protein
MLQEALGSLPAEYRNYAIAGMPMCLAGTGHAERLLGRANDVYQLGGTSTQAAQQGAVNLSGPSTAGPHANYSHNVAQTQGTYYVPLENVGKIKTTGKEFTGAHLSKCLDKSTPERRARFMEKHGIVQTPEGKYMLPVQQSGSGFTAFAPGMSNNPVGASTFDILQRTSWIAPVIGFVGGGLPGLIGGLVAGSALKSAAGAYSSSGNLLAPGLGGGSYLGNIGGVGAYGGLATAAQAMGLEGMAFNMRKQMNAVAEDFKDDTLISMINNPGIPIEDLIFLFMAHMADKYDKRLREKMEETAQAEKRERDRERKQDQARMLGGIASLVPGVGSLIGSAIQMGVNEQIRVQDALNGSTKSSTILMQEVQILMQKWKQINEMLSNLSKSLHEMAMTPIRNLR